MTIDTSVATRLQGRSFAWRLGASTTAAIGVLLVTWAISLDVVKASGGGFFGDAATYYTLGHSLASDFDFTYQRDDLVRVWEEFPTGPEGLFLKRGRDAQLFFAKAYIYPLLAAPFIRLFGTNGFLVLHALLMTLCFACAYSFLAARSHPVAALIFAFAFLFVSLVPIYMVQLGPDFFIFAIVLIAFFFGATRKRRGPRRSPRRCRGGRAGSSRRVPTSSRRRCWAWRRLPSRPTLACSCRCSCRRCCGGSGRERRRCPRSSAVS